MDELLQNAKSWALSCKKHVHFAKNALSFAVLTTAVPTANGEIYNSVLTVSGSRNGEAISYHLDRNWLEGFEQHCFLSKNEWVDQPHEYCGPKFSDLYSTWGLPSERIRATALNAYSAEIVVSELIEAEAIFALTSDGEYLTARDKGPIWIMFDLTKHPYAAHGKYRFYWVWQLAELVTQPQ